MSYHGPRTATVRHSAELSATEPSIEAAVVINEYINESSQAYDKDMIEASDIRLLVHQSQKSTISKTKKGTCSDNIKTSILGGYTEGNKRRQWDLILECTFPISL